MLAAATKIRYPCDKYCKLFNIASFAIQRIVPHIHTLARIYIYVKKIFVNLLSQLPVSNYGRWITSTHSLKERTSGRRKNFVHLDCKNCNSCDESLVRMHNEKCTEVRINVFF